MEIESEYWRVRLTNRKIGAWEWIVQTRFGATVRKNIKSSVKFITYRDQPHQNVDNLAPVWTKINNKVIQVVIFGTHAIIDTAQMDQAKQNIAKYFKIDITSVLTVNIDIDWDDVDWDFDGHVMSPGIQGSSHFSVGE